MFLSLRHKHLRYGQVTSFSASNDHLRSSQATTCFPLRQKNRLRVLNTETYKPIEFIFWSRVWRHWHRLWGRSKRDANSSSCTKHGSLLAPPLGRVSVDVTIMGDNWDGVTSYVGSGRPFMFESFRAGGGLGAGLIFGCRPSVRPSAHLSCLFGHAVGDLTDSFKAVIFFYGPALLVRVLL